MEGCAGQTTTKEVRVMIRNDGEGGGEGEEWRPNSDERGKGEGEE